MICQEIVFFFPVTFSQVCSCTENLSNDTQGLNQIWALNKFLTTSSRYHLQFPIDIKKPDNAIYRIS